MFRITRHGATLFSANFVSEIYVTNLLLTLTNTLKTHYQFQNYV